MPNLFILTLTWNGIEKLTKLKESLVPALKDLNWTWLIKDNASQDSTVETVNSWDNKNIKIIPYKNNLQNFSQGCNLLFNEASPEDNDDILLLNNDVIFNDTSSIKKMIKCLHEDNTLGAVGARLMFTGTNKLQHAGVVIDDKIKAPAHFRLNQDSDNNAIKNRLFQIVTGAVLLTKAEYYKNVCNNPSGNRGMDEKFHWGFDDVDLCLAIRYNMEKQILYCGGTNIYHEDSASLKKAPTNRLFLANNLNNIRIKWIRRWTLDKEIYLKDPKYNLYHA